MKVLLLLLVGLAFVTPLIRREEVDDWLQKQNEEMQSWKSPSLPYKIPVPPVTRKEYRCLNDQERTNFHNAIQKTKETMIESEIQYDYFVSRHKAKGAHRGPAFAPWHRHYLSEFEKVLRTHCSDCALPFWDSRLEKRLGKNPQHSVLFSSHLAGNAFGPVISGFAANWTTIEECKYVYPTLVRYLKDKVDDFMDDEAVRFPSHVTSHEELSVGWDDTFETNHGKVHLAFGFDSHMRNPLCSPADPMFILHHSFIDNLFERARKNIKRTNPPLKWTDPKTRKTLNDWVDFHKENATMKPFKILNRVGLFDESYTTSHYNYEKSPGDVTGCQSDSECCGNGYKRFVWCDVETGRCLSKVVDGGGINSTFPSKACFCSGSSSVPYNSGGECRCSRLVAPLG